MAGSYQQWVNAGMNPNQAALQAQLAQGGGSSTPITAAPQVEADYQSRLRQPGQNREGTTPVGAAPGVSAPLPASGPATRPGSTPAPPAVAPPAAPSAPSAPAAGSSPSYAMEGFDAGKLGNPEHLTPKYQIARTIQGFDPKAGITPEVIAALNALGIGSFEALSGDKVRVNDADPRFEGATTIDLVRGFNGPGGGQAWQYGIDAPDGGGAPAAGAPGGGGAIPMMQGAPLNANLQGDAIQRIQDALQRINGQGQVNIDALLSQLQGVAR